VDSAQLASVLRRTKRLLRARVTVALSFVLVPLSVIALATATQASSATGTIVSRGPAASATFASDSTTSLRLSVPAGTQVGDVLVASLGFGKNPATAQPTLTAPAGWALVRRTDQATVGAVAVYTHVFASGETGYTWTTNVTVGGAAFLAAFGGVDTTSPIDISAGQATPSKGKLVSAPSVTTSAANATLVSSYFGYMNKSTPTTWSPPTGMTEIGDAANTSGSRSSSLDYAVQATPGASGVKTANASVPQDYGVAVLTALRPADVTSGSPPVISSPGAGSITTSGATIAWTTDQASDSQVEYGTTALYGSSTTLDSVLVTSHSQALTGLTAGTTYHYRVKSRNAFAQLTTSGDLTFTTASPADTTPPVISAVAASSVTRTGATIGWTTNEASDTQVEYGTTTAYGSATTLDPSLATSHSQGLTGLAAGTLYHYRVKTKDAAGNLASSQDLTFQTDTTGPVPLIVDTDIFSDADDVGALATAFGLQIKGEASVIAIGVNTRLDRPSVATNSWKCVAALTHFYNSDSVPIGSDSPSNGTAVNTVDFVGPCSTLAPLSTPTPDTAVNVYRRALAGQEDGSVVMAGTGYFGNLSALLNSPGDAISPLSGRDLIAQKVKRLVVMAGGYPSRNGETNLVGDPPAAQDVAGNWPTKIVWSGYEVGDAIHTGNTISSKHPASSPVRVAYEAFVGPSNWIYSYDLTALYHAVRPADSLLTEAGPGTNVVSSSGGNTFTMGSGNQYYLQLTNTTALDSSIEALLDTLPAAPPADTTPPVISAISAGSVTAAGATISWTTNESADTQVEYGTTTGYGSATTLNAALSTSHSQALSALTAGTLYHYRVKSRDAAGNLATSPDSSFTTATSADTTPPVISAVNAGSVTAAGATISWTTNESADTQVEYGTTTGYGSATTLNAAPSTSHSQALSALTAGTLYHYRVKSRDAAGNLATSADFTLTTASAAATGPNDNFDSNTIDPARWTAVPNGSSVVAANQELEITHLAGSWTKGAIQSVSPHDQTGRSLQLQMKRAANNGLGGSTYGETSVFLSLDATHYVKFFVAGGSLTAWVSNGAGEVNITPSWPGYSATNVQWLRFRESGGTLYWEYASGATSPGAWTVLTSAADPFPMNAVTFKIVAGSNVQYTDTAQFDNISTY
jgi:hypothetical protein